MSSQLEPGIERGTQQVQQLQVTIRPTKLKKDQYVLGKPVKLYWDRQREPLIRCALAAQNSSWLIGDTLLLKKDTTGGEMFAQEQKASRYTNSIQSSEKYQCGPLLFSWNRDMLFLENMFILENIPSETTHLSIIFQA